MQRLTVNKMKIFKFLKIRTNINPWTFAKEDEFIPSKKPKQDIQPPVWTPPKPLRKPEQTKILRENELELTMLEKTAGTTPQNTKDILMGLLPVVILFSVALLLAVLNYRPDTFLSGWDTLHPEFDFKTNSLRSLFGVFRTEQGLGAVAAHSHMTELPRIVILYIFSLFFPVSFLRYLYIFTTLIIGPVGMYLFLRQTFIKSRLASFLGGLFYLLNLGAMQTFLVPFEMFTTMYALLPFVFLYAIKYLFEPNHKIRNLFIFSLFMLFMSPSAYAATLWYVFFIAFTVFFLMLSILRSSYVTDKPIRYIIMKLNTFRSLIILLLATLIINSYWILPNIYFIKTHAYEVQGANINKLFSQMAFYKNKEFGNVPDVLLLKNFYFDWPVYSGNGSFDYLTDNFDKHLKNPLVLAIAYLLAACWVSGIIFHVKNERLKAIPLLLLTIFSMFFLFNENPPFATGFSLLQQYIPFFKEAMRFPGDKILNIFVFIVSIYFAYSQIYLLNFLKQKRVPVLAVAGVVSLLLAYYMLPGFNGNYISPYMKIKIPDEYFRLYTHLQNKGASGKIAIFPIHSPWGWSYYNSQDNKYPGYQGAGFMYFGLSQPYLDRDFDRWSPYNENYYREMSYAVYKNDPNLFLNTINKYNISYIIVDKNITAIPNNDDVLYFDQIDNLIKKTILQYDLKQFDNISLFYIKGNKNIAQTKPNLTHIYPYVNTAHEDTAYQYYRDYGSFPENIDQNYITPYALFPFRSLVDNQSKLNRQIASLDNDNIIFKTNGKTKNFYHVTDFGDSMAIFPSDVIVEKDKDNKNITMSFYPNIAVFDTTTFSSPVSSQFSIPQDSKGLMISINQRYNYTISDLQDNTAIALGKLFLENDNNTVSLFSTPDSKPVSNLMTKINPVVSSCQNTQSPEAVNIYINDDKIIMTGTGDICMQIPLFNLISQEEKDTYGEILFNQDFVYKGNKTVSACILNIQNGSCIYYPKIESLNNKITLLYAIKTLGADNTALQIILKDNLNLDQEPDEISGLALSTTAPYQEGKITQEAIKKTFIKNDYIQFENLVIPKNTQSTQDSDITVINRLSNDCKSNNVARKDLINDNGVRSIKYYSEKGSFCDHFTYNDLPHKQAFLVFIESKNAQGLPLTTCISNYTSRKCDVYSPLSSWKNYNYDIFLLPDMDENGVGYDVNFENIGIRGTPSENYVKSIEFVPIPLELLQGVKVENLGKKPQDETSARITKIDQYNPLLYSLSVKNPPSPYVVNLNYSYEKGFKAYYLTCGFAFSCKVKAYLIPLFGREINDHLLVNNWSNGWVIDKKVKDNQRIVISFIPQYYQYFGLVMMFVFLAGLLIYPYYKNRFSRHLHRREEG